MTRTEAIAIITAKLASLDDERVQTVAGIVQSMQDDVKPLRKHSARELTLLEKSKADFSVDRSYSVDDSIAFVGKSLAQRAVPKSKT